MPLLFAPSQARAPCAARVCRQPAVSRRCVPAFAAADSTEAVRQTMASALGGQLSVGSIAGFAVGYGAKRIGQLLMVMVGVEIVALQLMAQRGWVDVNWNKITRDISPHIERDGLDRVMHTLKFRVPFAGAFTAGMYAGVRWT